MWVAMLVAFAHLSVEADYLATPVIAGIAQTLTDYFAA
jgi:hypothetical protein